jgi:hypothetical protein
MIVGLPAFAWEGIAVLLPALLIWRASIARRPIASDSGPTAEPPDRQLA